MAAWWTFNSTANAPSGVLGIFFNPLMTVISHSGWARFNGKECKRADCLHSCAQSPGGGSAM